MGLDAEERNILREILSFFKALTMRGQGGVKKIIKPPPPLPSLLNPRVVFKFFCFQGQSYVFCIDLLKSLKFWEEKINWKMETQNDIDLCMNLKIFLLKLKFYK